MFLKELINKFSSPEYSFTFVTILFFVGLRYYKFFASKKFGYALLVGSLVTFGLCMTDPVFQSVILWPDNIPITILLVVIFFFTWYAFHKASINDDLIDNGEPPVEARPENKEKVWCWPNLVYTELFCIIACTVFLTAWAIIFKAPLEEPANPTWAPNPAKAPWYFLGLQEMLVYFDPWIAGVVLPGLIVVGLIAIPYIDFNPKGNGYYCFKDRKFAITSYLFGWLILWNFLIIIGTFLRGPNWTFYGPFEFWDHHKVVAEYNINLSEYFYVLMLNKPMPGSILLRELPGFIFVGLYFFGSIGLINKLSFGREMRLKMGVVRYYTLILLFLSMGSMPVKMYLRWLFNLKYLIAMPEFEFNV